MGQTVAILGASTKPERYSYKAFKMLKEYGHNPLPVAPVIDTVEGVKAVASVKDLTVPIDTLTMYVGAKLSTPMTNDIIALHPKRVIFNPGSENPELAEALKKANIQTLEACTLVLLRTNQFDPKP